MVKLAFKPSLDNEIVVESMSSKKKEPDPETFRPFKDPPQPLCESHVKEYLPVKELVGMETAHYIVNNWYNNANKVLLLVGPTGCGKTTLVESYCHENDIQIYRVKSSDNHLSIKSKRDLLKDIFVFSEFSKTNFFLKRETKSRKLIFIDEFQNGNSDILSATDIHNLHLLRNQATRIENKRELKLFLGDLECPFTLPPILVVSADSKGSKLSDMKKLHEVFYIPEINNTVLHKWIITRFNTLDPDFAMQIVKRCGSDKRLLINTVEFVLKSPSDEIDESFIDSFQKDEEIGMYRFLEILFNEEETGINEIFKLYDTDGFMLSNLVHENYLEYNDDIHAVAKTAEAISIGETLFSDTYESLRTFVPELHCLHSLCIPSYYSRSDRPNRNVRSSCINNRYNIYLNNHKLVKLLNKSQPVNERALDIFDILTVKKFLSHDLVKTKTLSPGQLGFINNIISALGGNIEKMELIYKHFSDFNEIVSKPKNFTIKFKEKIKNNNNNV